MANPNAMLMIMLAGDPASIDLYPGDERYERLFAVREQIVTALRDDQPMAELLTEARLLLESDFSAQIDEADVERGIEIVGGLYTNPREIDDLTETQIEAIEDTAVCAGFMRTMMRSYDVDLMSDPLWLQMIMRYRRFLS